jgi:hypothetical protein
MLLQRAPAKRAYLTLTVIFFETIGGSNGMWPLSPNSS